MDPALLIPIIGTIFGCAIPISLIWTKHLQKIAEINATATAQDTAEKAAQYAAHNARLEDRLQVLERIVTDRGYDVATQIEALRDTRQVENADSGVPPYVMQKETA